MSHSIITLKLILATVGIIDRLNVCHSAPVRRWTRAPGWCMLAPVSSAIRAAMFTTPSNPLWLRGLQTFSGFQLSCIVLHILLHWHSLYGGDSELYGSMIFWGERGFKTVILLHTREMELSPLNNELQVPGSCQGPSESWQGARQVPGRQEPQLRLKPIHQRF